MKGFILSVSLFHTSLGAMILVFLFLRHGSASLKRIDNNYCLGDEVIYECNSSTYFYWQFTIGNETETFSFSNRREGYSVSQTIKSVNLTAIITKVNNTATSVFTFLASRELHGGMVTCDGESLYFYIYALLPPVVNLASNDSALFTVAALLQESSTPSIFNYSLLVSSSTSLVKFNNSKEPLQYNFMTGKLYNFTLTNTDCSYNHSQPAVFHYCMRCPFLDVIPGLNQYMYTITTDGSLNITGKCGNDKQLLFECRDNSGWRISSTCKNNGENEITSTTEEVTIKIDNSTTTDLFIPVLVSISSVITASFSLIVAAIFIFSHIQRRKKASIATNRSEEVYQQLSYSTPNPGNSIQEPHCSNYQQLETAFSKANKNKTQLTGRTNIHPDEYSTILQQHTNDEENYFAYDVVGKMATAVCEDTTLAVVVQKTNESLLEVDKKSISPSREYTMTTGVGDCSTDQPEPGCAEVSSIDSSNSLAKVAEKKETN